MHSVTLLVFVFGIVFVQGNIEYNTRQYGTSSTDIFNEVAVNPNTNDFFAVGSTGGSFASSSNGGQDIIVSKFSIDNIPLWNMQIGTVGDDFGNGVALGKDTNELYVVGSLEGMLSTFGETYLDLGDAFLAKMNASDGSLLWLTQWGTPYHDTANAVAYYEHNDTIIVAGVLETSEGDSDVFVAKYLTNGTRIALIMFNSDGIKTATLADIAVDMDGAVYLCGAVNSSFLYIAKVNSTGSVAWSRGSPDATGQLTSIVVDGTGDVWAAGITTAEWVEGVPLPNRYSYHSLLIIKIETITGFPTHSVTLASNGSDTGAYGLAVDDDLNLYVVGFTFGSELLGEKNTANETADIVLLKYDIESDEFEYLDLQGTTQMDIAYAVSVSTNEVNGQPVWFAVGGTNGSWTEEGMGLNDALTIVGTASKPEKKSQNLSTGAVIGIAVGVPLVLFAGAGLAIYSIRRSRHYRLNRIWGKSLKEDKDMHLSTLATNQSSFKIDYDEIELGTEIGQGAFGVVYRGKWRNSSVAVKQFRQDKVMAKSLQDFLKEATNVSKLRSHRNVCQVYGVCVDPQKPLCIVMEYVPDNLQDLIYSKKIPIDVINVLSLSKQIASGMSHIHHENILHCDLACRNLLVQSKGNNKYVIKITDFGLARVVDNDQYNATSQLNFPVRWSAPEVLMQHKISKASDVWSFGVVMWEMAEGAVPYYELTTHTEVITYVCQQNKRLPKPTKVELHEELLKIMNDCWATDPADRPTFEVIHKRLADLKNLLVPSNRGSSLLVGNAEQRIAMGGKLPEHYYNNFKPENNRPTDNYNNLDPQ